MTHDQSFSRRMAIKGAVAAGAGLALGAGFSRTTAAEEVKTTMKYKNSDFYKADGTFDAAKGKQAYFDMMKRFNYPVFDRFKDKDMWVVDFSLGDFVNVGMGGIMWWNDKQYSYFGHEIFLLPGQMIAEHAHAKTADAAAKMEAWHVRHGMIYTLGEGEATNPMPVELPKSQEKFITVKHCQVVKPGEVVALNRPEAKHFMVGGPEGAIVTEYATYHDGAALRFTNPGVKF